MTDPDRDAAFRRAEFADKTVGPMTPDPSLTLARKIAPCPGVFAPRRSCRVDDGESCKACHGTGADPQALEAIREFREEAERDARRWRALKEWLVDTKTNGPLAEDSVSMVRDLVYLIEMQTDD